MKMNKFLLGVLTCATWCACSNDESALEKTPDLFTGDEAYISVRLTDANAHSRATDGGFEYGKSEQEVENAYFYFYDKDGLFVTEGSAWNGGNASSGTPVGNIEFKSNTVVVLKGLNQKSYPKYMVTVLNRPESFKPGNTLTEMEKVLASSTQEGICYTKGSGEDQKTYFTMSTTSWGGQTNAENESMKYFVTEVKEANFSAEPITDEIPNPVTVYVERLAAKVTLKTSLTGTTENGKTLYKINATVVGEDNDADGGAYEELYVQLVGWKLNATAKHSYIVKNIDESWTESSLGFAWNDATNHRSYWAKSFNYGQGSYPAKAEDLYGDDNTLTENTYLNYVSLNDGTTAINGDAYCAENTNTAEIVKNSFPSAVTSILLKAVICDANGNALDLVRYNGMLFKQDRFLKYILSQLQTKNELNVYIKNGKDTDGNDIYEQIGTSYVKLASLHDGNVKVVFAQPENDSNTLYYKDENNYTEIDPADATNTTIAALNSALATASDGAVGYTGGLMYYNIPIEHLNPIEEDQSEIEEANYGVVRNHHYVVTVNKLENIGKGIFDPEEVIVPNDEDRETYYVGATINILSWKLVNQDVDL